MWKITINILFLLSQSLSLPVPTERSPRTTVAEWQTYSLHEPSGPGTYAFGFDIEEAREDNVQFRHEERHPNGTVTGEYGFVTPDGSVHIVNYVADRFGYRAHTDTRARGFGKPVRFNEEEDIANAIVAANFARRTKVSTKNLAPSLGLQNSEDNSISSSKKNTINYIKGLQNSEDNTIRSFKKNNIKAQKLAPILRGVHNSEDNTLRRSSKKNTPNNIKDQNYLINGYLAHAYDISED